MDKILRFNPEDDILKFLADKDECLKKLFIIIGEVEIRLRQNYFESLVMSIIGQQLSSKAAETIRNRVKNLCFSVTSEITPQTIMALPFDQLRAAGVSNAKISYIYDLAQKVVSGVIDFQKIIENDNSELIKTLTSVKGIGKWTAEMFLIFSLGRMNVLSTGDAGLQRATKWLYNMPDNHSDKYLEQHSRKWEPYESIVSLYLWEAIDQRYVDSGKTFEEVIKN